MTKKLEGNGLWESSRMMLPEHKERIRQHQVDLKKKEKPIMDEQHLEHLIRCIGVAMFTEKDVRIKLFGEFEDKEVVGKIDKIATESSQLKVSFEDSFEWINLDDVVEMEIDM